jgi:hypothetical protein
MDLPKSRYSPGCRTITPGQAEIINYLENLGYFSCVDIIHVHLEPTSIRHRQLSGLGIGKTL